MSKEYKSRIDEENACSESFSYFAENYVKIRHWKHDIIPLKLYPFQQRLVDSYQNYPYVIGVKFRQGGFTTMTVVYALWKCMFYLDQSFNVYSKTDREAIHLGKIATQVLDNLPDWMRPKLERNTQHEKKLPRTNSQLSFYTLQKARGKSITHAFIDEAAFIPNMLEHWKAMYPTIACGGKCFVLSTANGVGNWFEETYHSALDEENFFHVFKSHYTEHPDFQDPQKIKEMKSNMGEKKFLQEIEGKFISDWQPTELPSLVDQLLEIASKKRLSKQERLTLIEAAYRLKYEDEEEAIRRKIRDLEERKFQILKNNIEITQSNLSSPSTK